MDDNSGCAVVIGIFLVLGLIGAIIENIGAVMVVLLIVAVIIGIVAFVGQKQEEKKKAAEEAAELEKQRQQQLDQLLSSKQKTWDEELEKLEEKYKEKPIVKHYGGTGNNS